MKANNLQNLTVSVLADGTLAFDRRAVEACGLRDGGKVAVMFYEARQRLVVHPVPDWMGGVRLTGQPNGMLTALGALDFLFDQFQHSQRKQTYDARWDAERNFIIVRMSLHRKTQ
jgi:hypothetical protein